MIRSWQLALFALLLTPLSARAAGTPARPNFVFVLVDDLGYGDLSCHGNPVFQTPHMDRLHAASVRFTDFCVSATCSPTRAALMTGRHEFRSGVTHTIGGRERLALDAVTLPRLLQTAGYATGLFGKWHLGDQGAYRPERRGFDVAVTTSGDTQNSHFDPTLLYNGVRRAVVKTLEAGKQPGHTQNVAVAYGSSYTMEKS
jgi:arylsulfatase